MKSEDRIPPHSMDAEQAVLGSMLIERAAIERAVEVLNADDFYRAAHRTIWDAIVALHERGSAVDLVTMEDELKVRLAYNSVGGQLYLMNLMEAPATAANIEWYAEQVANYSARRRAIAEMEASESRAYDVADPVDSILDDMEGAAARLRASKRAASTMHKVGDLAAIELELLSKRMERKGEPTGISTGLSDLDYHLLGFQPTDLVLIAARPGAGKSSLGVQFAVAAAMRHHTSLILSLEMPRSQLVMRILGAEARVPLYRIRTGYVSANDYYALGTAVERLKAIPLYMDDSPATASQIKAKCRRLKRDAGSLELVML